MAQEPQPARVYLMDLVMVLVFVLRTVLALDVVMVQELARGQAFVTELEPAMELELLRKVEAEEVINNLSKNYRLFRRVAFATLFLFKVFCLKKEFDEEVAPNRQLCRVDSCYQ